jgi:hypothetical protein
MLPGPDETKDASDQQHGLAQGGSAAPPDDGEIMVASPPKINIEQ